MSSSVTSLADTGRMRYEEPEFAPWDGRRVPLTFVAGYLGAGKTTLINQVLARTTRPTAVFVNDVGEIALDAHLIRRRHGDTIELADGCVCCSLADGFGAAFDTIRARPEPPDHLLVELSGVADPARVLPWGRTAGFVLDGVITVVDAERAPTLLADPVIESHVVAQIRAADLVLMSKTDLVTSQHLDALASRLTALAGESVPLISADDWAGAAALLELGGRRPGGVAHVPPSTLFDQHAVRTVPDPGPVTRDELEYLLDSLGPSVVRVKGIVVGRGPVVDSPVVGSPVVDSPVDRRASDTGGHGQSGVETEAEARSEAESSDSELWLVQQVGSRRSITRLPASEFEAPTGLVVIELAGHNAFARSVE